MVIRRYKRVPREIRRGNVIETEFHPIGLVEINIDSTGRASVGFSQTHRNDRFNKSVARSISDGRMNSNKYTMNINDPDSVASVSHQIPYKLEETFYSMIEWLARPNRNIK